ncbi:twin-arginine translocation signal domain-containing protein [Halorussus litoreus]|uniref:twin-arginine translocation signal domain-containing protein n=1 Tax=Halorussus litoreus TaxID=1710536 RepID=UPI000E27122C|nr:twin-arginine translocation signal domain-containing protein [Halorussus litoreus]
MTNDSPDDSRRQFLKSAAALGVGALGVPLLSREGSAQSDSDSPGPEKFRVTGHEIVKMQVTPDSVTIEKRKVSDDLARRYGLTPPVLTTTETFDRPKPEADDLPQRATETTKRPWDTYYAKTDEWKAHFESTRGVGTEDHDPDESDQDYGIWEYEAVDGGYETSAPMNIISEKGANDVAGVLTSNGWTDSVVQYNRYAWNSDTYSFEQQHESVATGTFGFLGREHLKMWEFGGYVSGSAHVDSSVPHEATSFEDAEQSIEGIFDDEAGWSGYQDYYYMDNGYKLDHDSYATKLVKY